MVITPTLASELVTLAFGIKDAVVAHMRSTKGADYQPTDEEILAELKTNGDAILSEGAAWKAAHPPSAG